MIAEIKLPDFEERFNRLESLFIALSDKISTGKLQANFDQEVIPISEIAGKGKLMSLPTLYKHVKDGKIELLKLGNRSYVSRANFYSAFSNSLPSDYSKRFKKSPKLSK